MLNFRKTKKWKVEALDIGLAIYPLPTESEPSRDGTCFEWSKIQKVFVYKADLLTTDLVCMVFEATSGASLEIHEELEGFEETISLLAKYLNGFPQVSEFWGDVTQPAFEANETVVWKR